MAACQHLSLPNAHSCSRWWSSRMHHILCQSSHFGSSVQSVPNCTDVYTVLIVNQVTCARVGQCSLHSFGERDTCCTGPKRLQGVHIIYSQIILNEHSTSYQALAHNEWYSLWQQWANPDCADLHALVTMTTNPTPHWIQGEGLNITKFCYKISKMITMELSTEAAPSLLPLRSSSCPLIKTPSVWHLSATWLHTHRNTNKSLSAPMGGQAVIILHPPNGTPMGKSVPWQMCLKGCLMSPSVQAQDMEAGKPLPGTHGPLEPAWGLSMHLIRD